MIEFIMNLAAVLGGVIGSAIGFVLFGVVFLLLALPYLMMTRRASSSTRNDDVKGSLT